MIDASDPDQSWVSGFVSGAIPQTANQTRTQVTLTNGISAYEVIFDAAPRLSSTVLKFISSPVPVSANLGGHLEGPQSRPTLRGMRGYIIGWTLSCRSENRVQKKFMVMSGGLTCDKLGIKVWPVTGKLGSSPSTWRCGIYFIDQNDFE